MRTNWFKRVGLLAVCLLVFGTALPCHAAVQAGAAESPDTAATEEELGAWLASHTEGTLTLTDTVTLTRAVPFYGPVVVDTGPHSLVLDGGYPHPGFVPTEDGGIDVVADQILVTGEGVEGPVVDVSRMGYFRFGNWNNYLYTLCVTATGREDAGGTALRIQDVGSGNFNFFDTQLQPPGQIRAYGPGAIGLELLGPFSVFSFDVAVAGAGGAAVSAPAGANICFCKLIAEGDGAQAVRGGGDILVDSCLARPAAGGDNIDVYQGSPFPLWWPVMQHSDEEDLQYELPATTLTLAGSSDVTASMTLYIDWEEGALDGFSTAAPGRLEITGQLHSAFLRELMPGEVGATLEVRGPDIPCIYATDTWSDGPDDTITHVLLFFWETEAWLAGSYTLSRSEDGGKTWRACTGAEGIRWRENGMVDIPVELIHEGVLFRLEAPGAGTSNIVCFSKEYGHSLGGIGGDRVGTDRLGASLNWLMLAAVPPDGEEPGEPGAPEPSDPPAPGPGVGEGESLGGGAEPIAPAASPVRHGGEQPRQPGEAPGPGAEDEQAAPALNLPGDAGIPDAPVATGPGPAQTPLVEAPTPQPPLPAAGNTAPAMAGAALVAVLAVGCGLVARKRGMARR